uniref:Transcription and mRNA export factor ENY2 n=1 Tax=Pseudo-nitzschia delicatissima TaxID=44447 RepID=A0A7S0UPQ0_9STRA
MTDLNKEKKKPVKLTKSEKAKRNLMLKNLHESGDFDRLKKDAYARLMLHPEGEAWREGIKQRTREAIETSNGGTDSIEEITLDELSETITKHGIRSIPPSIREEFLSKIKQACRVHDARR